MRTLLAIATLALTVAAPLRAGQAGETSAGTLRIYLARHGESESNLKGETTGWIDAALTRLGRQQARELADMLRDVKLDAVYSSTLSRSRDTALAAAGGVPVRQLPALRERNWGRFAGKPANDPEFLRRRLADDDSLDGGETRQAFFERVRDAVAQIRREHPAGTVLVVGHGATNQQVLRALLDLTAGQAATIEQGNDEIYALDFYAGRPPILWKVIRERTLGEL
jgi:broad specificity phosphatase PhoE